MTVLEVSEAGSGRPPILFLHGLGGDHTSFDPQLDHFAADHLCVAWTMPGYGTSDPLPDMTFESLAERAAALIDDKLGGSAVVVGQSMGGMIAQQLAVAHPDRVEALVLIATTAAFGRPGSTFNEEFLAARLSPLDEGATPASLAPGVVDGLVGPTASEDVRRAAIESMRRIEPDAYRAALACLVGWDGTSAAEHIGVPTLCVAGEVDATAPVRAMERLADLIPDARLDVLAGCGHFPHLERADDFNALLDRFLR